MDWLTRRCPAEEALGPPPRLGEHTREILDWLDDR